MHHVVVKRILSTRDDILAGQHGGAFLRRPGGNHDSRMVAA
jgi:hypothetical protein